MYYAIPTKNRAKPETLEVKVGDEERESYILVGVLHRLIPVVTINIYEKSSRCHTRRETLTIKAISEASYVAELHDPGDTTYTDITAQPSLDSPKKESRGQEISQF
jgi:hypothetical protein